MVQVGRAVDHPLSQEAAQLLPGEAAPLAAEANFPRSEAAQTDKLFWGLLAVLLLLVPLSRLPQFLGGKLVPDGDESLIGLIALHMLQGRPWPVFIYGQDYGIVTPEAGGCALGFAAFGVKAAVLKGCMLTLWAVGWTAMVLAIRRLAGSTVALLGGALLLLGPVCANWSMKAWGFWHLSFLLTNLALLGLSYVREARARRRGLWAAVGACCALTSLSQPLWILAIAPFLPWAWWSRRDWQEAGAFLLGAVLSAAAVLLAARGHPSYHVPQLFGGGVNPVEALCLTPVRLWVCLSGCYCLTRPAYCGASTAGAAALGWLGVAGALLACLARLRWRRPLTPAQLCALGACLCVAATLFMNNEVFGYRYLLPAAQMLLVSLAAGLGCWIRRQGWRRLLALFFFAALALSGGFSLVEFQYPPDWKEGYVPDPERLEALVNYLGQNKVKHVYTNDPRLTWTLMFASRGELKARWFHEADRYPEIPRAVDGALYRGEPVALVAPGEAKGNEHVAPLSLPRAQVVAQSYLVELQPTARELAGFGFVLNAPGGRLQEP